MGFFLNFEGTTAIYHDYFFRKVSDIIIKDTWTIFFYKVERKNFSLFPVDMKTQIKNS